MARNLLAFFLSLSLSFFLFVSFSPTLFFFMFFLSFYDILGVLGCFGTWRSRAIRGARLQLPRQREVSRTLDGGSVVVLWLR